MFRYAIEALVANKRILSFFYLINLCNFLQNKWTCTLIVNETTTFITISQQTRMHCKIWQNHANYNKKNKCILI